MLMSGPRRLGQELASLLANHGTCVLATVVRTEGHTYRKAGAQMLVWPDGEALGLLSGGCLEDQIVAEAGVTLASGLPQLLYFDLTADEEYLVGYGKGCFGRLWILLEPVSPARGALTRAVLAGLCRVAEPTGVALVYEVSDAAGSQLGRRVVLGASGAMATDFAEEAAAAPIAAQIAAGLAAGKPFDAEAAAGPGRLRYSVSYQLPTTELLLFGAGPDVLPVVALACQLGWDARVFDHRPAYARPGRLPGAASLGLYNPDAIGVAVVAKERSAVVVMTHNLLVDLRLLRWAAGLAVPYVGLLGPVHRRERLFELAREDGDDLRARLAGRLHSPIGLSLGGDAEADIALAVIAQVQQVSHGAAGGHRGVVAASGNAHAPPSPPKAAAAAVAL